MASKYIVIDEYKDKGLKTVRPEGVYMLDECSQKQLKKLYDAGLNFVEKVDSKADSEKSEDGEGQ
jgi:hypothetical protein